MIIKFIKDYFRKWKKNREYNRRIKELKKRDPFTYKNF